MLCVHTIYEVPRNSKLGFAIRWHQSDINWLVNLANLIKLSMEGRHSFVFKIKNASIFACLNSVLLESRVILLCAWSCCLTLLCLRSLYYGVFCLVWWLWVIYIFILLLLRIFGFACFFFYINWIINMCLCIVLKHSCYEGYDHFTMSDLGFWITNSKRFFLVFLFLMIYSTPGFPKSVILNCSFYCHTRNVWNGIP